MAKLKPRIFRSRDGDVEGKVQQCERSVRSIDIFSRERPLGVVFVILRDVPIDDVKDLIDSARQLRETVSIESAGDVTLDNVRKYAEAGADIIAVASLTQSVRARDISFQMQLV